VSRGFNEHKLTKKNTIIWLTTGAQEIPGLTDTTLPRRLGPKRASRIRKLFNLSKEDDVRKYVIRRPLPVKEGKPAPKKPRTKAPKIQRLITPRRLYQKRKLLREKRERSKKRKEQATEYAQLLAQRYREAMKKKEARRKRLSSAWTQSTSSE
jgi:small subunit ribosomal protein S6e